MDRKQIIKTIWGMASELRISKDEVYALLLQETGREHMSDCSNGELEKLMKLLGLFKDEIKHRAGRLTDKQLYLIKSLEKQIGWADDPKHLKNFIKRQTKVEFLEWLTVKQASGIIIALKNIKSEMNKKADGEVM